MNIIYRMSIWNKILIGLIGVAALFLYYTAARTLKTYQYWYKTDQALQTKLESLQQSNLELRQGKEDGTIADGSKSIRALQAELNKLLINRGRVWDKCEPQKVTERTGVIAVNTDPAVPNHISDKMVLYVFEDTEEKKASHYLGEFKVTEVGDNRLTLAPTAKPSDAMIRRLSASKGPWLLYEVMPVDRHEIFADLSDEDRKVLLPEASLAEYNRDGQTAENDDPKECKVDGKFKRHLRDYKALFDTARTETNLLADAFEGLHRDAEYLKSSADDAKQQQQFSEREFASLQADLARARKEQQAVAAHVSLLQRRLAFVQQQIEKVIGDNTRMAAEIARIQLDAARMIEQRTHSMAQFGPGS